ncbi:MAG: late competence development ComFB family protein [Rhodoferax sp.]
MVYAFEQVHNYYERLVFEEVARRAELHPGFSADMLADVACVTLNRLPTRYVRHDVDLMFYLTEQERQTIEQSLEDALTFAFGFVASRTHKPG